MTVSRVAELTSIVIAVVSLAFWTGSTANDVAANKAEIAEVKADSKKTPTDVAVLQTQVGTLQSTVQDVKDKQKSQDEKLDKILEEVRKR